MALAVVSARVRDALCIVTRCMANSVTFLQGIYVAENSLFIQESRYLWAFNIIPRAGEPPLSMTIITVE